MSDLPDLEAIQAAARRIAPHVHRTPVLTCRSLNAMCDGELFFKCENFQKIGAFKMRGAMNAVSQLNAAQIRAGVATHSSGNHGAALALAARIAGARAYVVMPDNASAVKKRAVEGYGAEISWCEPSLEGRDRVLAEVVARTGATVVHPYNDDRIIAGQGTAALELLEDHPGLELLVTPVGGGGLISGSAIVAKSLNPGLQVIGVEPDGADDAARSLQAGQLIVPGPPRTIADGLLASLGDRTFAVIRRHVDGIVTVSDDGIIAGMRAHWERMKIVVEPSASVSLGAILSGRLPLRGRRCGVILSGGNVDLDRLPWVTDR